MLVMMAMLIVMMLMEKKATRVVPKRGEVFAVRRKCVLASW